MKTAVTIGGYALGLLAVFGAAFGVGAVLAPGSLADKPGAVTEDHGARTAGGAESTEPAPGGLMVTQDGYTEHDKEPMPIAAFPVHAGAHVTTASTTPVHRKGG